MVLDSGPEAVFDNLTRLASTVCGTAIGLISLIDADRQWFKAQTGLPDMRETPRDLAFCAHAILDDALLEVPDARQDARFADNPLVTGAPQFRFYAGAPLVLPGGERVGTLCVIGREEQTLSAQQADILRALARIATDTLQMRRDLIASVLLARSDHEQILAASEAQHRAIVEEQSELISLALPDGTLVYVNPAYARHFGRTPVQLTGHNLFDYVEPSDRGIVRERIAWVLSTGQMLAGENKMHARNGSEVWVAWTNSVQLMPDGSRLLRSVGRDVSARQRAETALRSSQAFLTRTERVAGVGGWELDLRSNSVTWSAETRRIHEVPDSFQPTLDSAIQFYAPEARPVIEAAVRNGMQSGQGWDLELPLITFNGRQIWARAVGEVEFEAGVAVKLVGAFQDISTRKQLEQRAADSERFVREVTDNLPVRIAYVDRELRYHFVNRAHCERFGLAREQIIGRSRNELLGAQLTAALAGKVAAVLAGTPQHFEFDEVVGGRPRRIESRLLPDFAGDGSVKGFFTTGIDITERSQAEQALRVLSTILEVSTDVVVQADLHGQIIYMNPAARRVLGLLAGTPLAGRKVSDLHNAHDNQRLQGEVMAALQQHGVWQGETTLLVAGGHSLPVSHLLIAHHGADGRIERMSAVMRDMSAEVAGRLQAARQTATLRSVTEALPAIVSAVDSALRYRFVNSAFEQWHGLRRDQVLGRSALDLLSPDDVQRSRHWAERALAGEAVQFERHYPARPGQPTLAVSYIPVRLDSGEVDGFVGVALDITPHRQEQVRLQALAERDPLTGLLNRAGFGARLQAALQAGDGPALALLYIDLDHFKPVNDKHGHPMGDQLLKAYAKRLQGLVRPTDAVARLGGDEFAILLLGLREPAAAQTVAAKVLEASHAPFMIGALQLQIGASVGVAIGSDAQGDDAAQELLQRADAQLYRAKQGGRGRQAGEASAWASLDNPGRHNSA